MFGSVISPSGLASFPCKAMSEVMGILIGSQCKLSKERARDVSGITQGKKKVREN